MVYYSKPNVSTQENTKTVHYVTDNRQRFHDYCLEMMDRHSGCRFRPWESWRLLLLW